MMWRCELAVRPTEVRLLMKDGRTGAPLKTLLAPQGRPPCARLTMLEGPTRWGPPFAAMSADGWVRVGCVPGLSGDEADRRLVRAEHGARASQRARRGRADLHPPRRMGCRFEWRPR